MVLPNNNTILWIMGVAPYASGAGLILFDQLLTTIMYPEKLGDFSVCSAIGIGLVVFGILGLFIAFIDTLIRNDEVG